METLLNFIMGFSAAVLPALVFISYYLHQSDVEVTNQLERRLGEAAMNLNYARKELRLVKKKAHTSERNNIELTKQKEELQEQLNGLGMRYLRDSLRALENQLDVTNLELSKRKAEKLIEVARRYGVRVDEGSQAALIAEMEESFNVLVKKEELKAKRQETQAKAEPAAKNQEVKRHLTLVKNDQPVAEKPVAKKEEARDQLAEIKWMREQLEKLKTKLERSRYANVEPFPGYVYVLSDKDNFGQNTYLVGATKRLEPMDIVREMGHDRVPFSFDVHLVIHSENAAGLEQKVHELLAEHRSQRVDFHPGFFELRLDKITDTVTTVHQQMQEEAQQARSEAPTKVITGGAAADVEVTEKVTSRIWNRAA